MFRLLTDFNEIDGDRVRGLEEDLQLVEELHQARSIQPGDRVLVHDGGEEAAGVVDRVENGLIYVLVDWSTFGPERRVHSGPHGVWWAATNDHIRMQDEGIAVTIDGVPAGDKTLAQIVRIDCALLCDATTVREGLLHVLGGGVTRINRPGYPAPLAPLALALRILVHPTETDRTHQLDVRLQGADGQEIGKFDVQFGIGDPGEVEPGEEVSVPLPLNMPPNVALPSAGRYSFELLIDGVHQQTVAFIAKHVPPGGEQ